jgi:hypothetical protein
MVIEGDEIMRDIEGDNEMLMVDIVIDVWQDSDGRGRHEGLWSTLQKCCKQLVPLRKIYTLTTGSRQPRKRLERPN